MSAPGDYNLSCVLLIAGPPSGLDRAAKARWRDEADRAGLRLMCRLTAAELEASRSWRVPPASDMPQRRAAAVESGLVRIGERAAWTDPAGL